MAGRRGSRDSSSLVVFDAFVAQVDRALRRCEWTGTAVAVVTAGLAERAGTDGGPYRLARDEVVRAAAGLILEEPSPAGAAAMVASGELAILCGNVADSGHADAVVRRIRHMADHPVDAGGISVLVATATGVAMASRPGETAEALITAASRAMRAAWQPWQPEIHAPGSWASGYANC